MSDTTITQRNVCAAKRVKDGVGFDLSSNESVAILQDTGVGEGHQMSAEYQELWKRYRKQSLRFRQLQKFLKASTKKLMEAAASDDATDRPSMDKQRSGATRCNALHTDTHFAAAPSVYNNKGPAAKTVRRRESEIASRDVDAEVSLGKDEGGDTAALFYDGLLGATDPFLSHDSSALDPSQEDMTLGVSPPSTRPSLSSCTSSAHRQRPSFGRVNWKRDDM